MPCLAASFIVFEDQKDLVGTEAEYPRFRVVKQNITILMIWGEIGGRACIEQSRQLIVI
jgi:hypothetical protein